VEKLDLLLRRFEEEMGHVTKDERILRTQFRALVSRLFPGWDDGRVRL